jgi:hypothetical protein
VSPRRLGGRNLAASIFVRAAEFYVGGEVAFDGAVTAHTGTTLTQSPTKRPAIPSGCKNVSDRRISSQIGFYLGTLLSMEMALYSDINTWGVGRTFTGRLRGCMSSL